MTLPLDAPAGLVQKAGAFIFDFDGTLYDAGGFTRRFLLSPPSPARRGPVLAASAEEPQKWSPADVLLAGAERRVRRSFAGCDYGDAETYYGEFFAALERRTGRSGVFLRAWYFRRYLGRMTETLGRFYPARPGAAELFATLEQRGIPRAVYSDYPALPERLGAIGLDPGLCGELFSPENFGAQKPAARPFLEIARTLCCGPEETLVVGDREDTDGAGAAAAGMMFLKIAAPADWEHLCALVQSGKGHG